MNKQSGRIGLYLVLIVALIAGYLYLNNQVAVQSDYTYGQLEQAVTDGKVTSATIHQNSEVPTRFCDREYKRRGTEAYLCGRCK